MGRKRKPATNAPSKPKTFRNTPFRHLDPNLLSPPTDIDSNPLHGSSPSEDPPDTPTENAIPENDDALLDQFMNDVTPIPHPLALRKPGHTQTRDPIPDEVLVMKALEDLVQAKTDFDIADTDEYIEAAVSGLDRRIIRKLRRGEFAIEAHLDLHGYNREEAREKVARFIYRSVIRGRRCVLIVHGRGLGSVGNIPVLKEKLRAWLTRGAMGKRVLAYTSARPNDGGTGAVYVLLRG